MPPLTPAFMCKFRDFVGNDDFEDYFENDFRPISSMDCYQPEPVDFAQFYDGTLPENTTSTTGVWGLSGGLPRGEHVEMPHLFSPLSTLRPDPKILEDYPFPQIRRVDRSVAVSKYHERGYATVGIAGGGLYEQCWYLRGMEQLMMDFALNPEFAHVLVRRVADVFCESARNVARWGCDVAAFHDDVGSQKSLQMSPAMWREFIKPNFARIIQAARNIKPDILWFYHTDGCVTEIVGELIEIGVNVLNPVQPEVMDPAAIKREYGDRLAFNGTISIQQTLPFGTVEDVRREVKERIATVGAGGGLILAPSHCVQPEVPLENLLALADAVREFGTY
jgi:uroporphyrinogen decarboxylase